MTTTTANRKPRSVRKSSKGRATTEERAAKREALSAELHEKITAAVAELHTAGGWTAYLDYMRSFHRYSVRNVMLIAAQRPNATAVAGFEAWKEKGRQVRKGEKAIRILGYATRKVTETDPTTGEDTEKKVPYFPILSVFDISQTDPIEGHPLAEAAAAPDVPRLTGDDTTGIYARLVHFLEARGWTVVRGETAQHEIDGTTSWGSNGSRTVTVRTDFDDAHAVHTLAHEAAHVLMHDPEDPANRAGGRPRIEVEAESVAYIVTGIYGLDATSNSAPYLASWSAADPDLMRETAEKVHATVKTITAAIDGAATDDAEK